MVTSPWSAGTWPRYHLELLALTGHGGMRLFHAQITLMSPSVMTRS